jgi:hypothetical protein
MLARHLTISRSIVHRVWLRHDVQPHRVERFKLSNDPHFEQKVRDVVGLYLDPPDRALVLCVDEKSQIQALDRPAPILPLRPGLPERQTHDYKRHGTTTAPLPPPRRSAARSFATDGSAGNQMQCSFFVLQKTGSRL